jgi:hypothetical protein
MKKPIAKRSVKKVNTTMSGKLDNGTPTFQLKRSKQVTKPTSYKETNKSLFMMREPGKKPKLQIAKTGSNISPKYRMIQGERAEKKLTRVLKRINEKNK